MSNLTSEMNQIFMELRSRQWGVQLHGAKQLQQFVIRHREYTDESIYRLMEHFKTTERNEILGCFLSINKLLKVIPEMRTVQFVHRFLPLIFQQLTSSDNEIIEKASDSLGHLAKVGGTLIAETI